MYLVGAAHPNKSEAQRLLERCIAERARLVTDVEVFQEILHRYVAIKRKDAIQPAFDTLTGVIDETFDVSLRHAQRAKEIVLGQSLLSARDAIHAAVMEAQGIDRILTFDVGFDAIPGLQRVR